MNAGVTDDQIIEAIEKMEELPNSVSIEREMKKAGPLSAEIEFPRELLQTLK